MSNDKFLYIYLHICLLFYSLRLFLYLSIYYFGAFIYFGTGCFIFDTFFLINGKIWTKREVVRALRGV